MIPSKFILIGVVFLSAGVLLNAGLIRYVINKAVRKFVKPNLHSEGANIC